jgi:O-antigen/teichoic acid export membrane protein
MARSVAKEWSGVGQVHATNEPVREAPRLSLGERIRTARIFSYALIEQGTFSAASFMIVFVLARWMAPSEFGRFSSFYAVFLLLQNVFDAIVVEPLAIFGSGDYRSSFRQYLARILVAHGLGTVVVAVLGLLALLLLIIAGELEAQAGVLALAVSSPLLLTRWIVRQPCYMMEHAEWSILANGAFVVIALGAFSALDRANALDSSSALLALAAASALASAPVAIIWLKPRWHGATHPLNIRTLATEHWGYGRWAIADKFLGWLTGQLFFLIVPLFAGFAAAGALRALITLMMPAHMTIMAMSGLLLPRFARLYASPDRHKLWSHMWGIMVVAVSVMALYGVLLAAFGTEVMKLVYLGKFDDYVAPHLVMLLAVGPILIAVITMFETTLRARGQVRLIFTSKVLPAIVSALAGIPLIALFGITGAILTSLSSWFMMAAALARQVRSVQKLRT